MGFSSRFEIGLVWRALLFLALLGLFLAALRAPGLAAGRIVAGLLALAALASLWHHIRRTNFEVARFIESIRFEDYSQRFSTRSGGGFDVLGNAFDEALKTMWQRRGATADDARFLSGVVDDAPVALLAIADSGGVDMLNKAARRLFAHHAIFHRDDLAAYGAEFDAALALPPGERRVTRLLIDGIAHRVIVASQRVERLGSGLTIASIQSVQSELGALEVAVQADLVRVLTHEIMNSLTPVTSLARSSAEMIGSLAGDDPALADARLAVETLANRADGILRFVESYRAFARSPTIERRGFRAHPWAQEIARLAAADRDAAATPLAISVEPASIDIDGDPDLLAQVVLNLVRNSAIALAGQDDRRIRLDIQAAVDGRVRIEVGDNGPGIAQERRLDVFLPFYTTRSGGSGVGLSFARQVVLAHGGTIEAGQSALGGAAIRLSL